MSSNPHDDTRRNPRFAAIARALSGTVLVLFLGFPACSTVSEPPPRGPSAAAIARWNGLLFEIAEAEDGLLTLKGLRTAAMMHLAVHDALNAVEPRFETWLGGAPAPDADPAAAASRAAYVVASTAYPGEAPRFRDEFARDLASAASGPAREAGLALGERIAAAMIRSREGDRWNGEATYEWHPMAPGVYAEFHEHSGTPEGFVFGAGWAAAEPFGLRSPAQFRAPPPPAIASAAYARAFDEVKRLGATESASRTADQSHLAMWWKDFVENSHNRLARRLVVEDGLDAWRAARLFALLEVSVYDGYLDVFDNKFLYNHWRPYTAIRWASHDGNPDTIEDPDWDNLHHHTYAFPSYPSAHGMACAAAAAVLEETFGSERPFSMTTERVDRAGPGSGKIPMEPATRSFASFREAAEECAMSRVYLGIHFRYDSVEGTALGRRVGEWIVANFLRPLATAAVPRR